jgi:uncharacterized membrane protein YidH (DUF202 family)
MTRDQGPPDQFDPGLARERTQLAWNRTGVSFIALGGAIVKDRPAVGLVILAMSTLIFVLARGPRPGEPGRRRPLLLITATVTAVSVAALTLALLAPS